MLSFPSPAQTFAAVLEVPDPDSILLCDWTWAADGAYVVHVTFLVMYCIYICKCCSYCDVTFMFEVRRTRMAHLAPLKLYTVTFFVLLSNVQ